MAYQNDHGLIKLIILNDKGLVKLVIFVKLVTISHINLVS